MQDRVLLPERQNAGPVSASFSAMVLLCMAPGREGWSPGHAVSLAGYRKLHMQKSSPQHAALMLDLARLPVWLC